MTFEFAHNDLALRGAHLTVSAGKHLQGARNHLFLKDQVDGRPMRLGEIPGLAENTDALKARLNNVMMLHYDDQPQTVYNKFETVLVPNGPEANWISEGMKLLYKRQVKAMLDEVYEIGRDLGMEYSTCFPVR